MLLGYNFPLCFPHELFLFFFKFKTTTLISFPLQIGLAVGDIEGVQKNAEIKQLSLMVSQIYFKTSIYEMKIKLVTSTRGQLYKSLVNVNYS